MKRLYKCTALSTNGFQTLYSVKKEKPTFFKAYPKQDITVNVLLQNVYWWLITKGKYRVWCAYDGDKVIHTTYVVPKCTKFPFLNKGSFEIGPSYTEPAYRGKGVFPAVLTQIFTEIECAYAIIEDTNAASIRGTSKFGFTVMPGEVKRDKFKRFIYIAEK